MGVFMSRFRSSLSACVLLLAAGCASAPSGAPVSVVQTQSGPVSDWNLLEDGTVEHVPSGGKCPVKLADFSRKSYSVLEVKEGGETRMDGICQYEDTDHAGMLSAYFYPTFGEAIKAHMQRYVGPPIVQRWPDAEYLDAESQACSQSLALKDEIQKMMNSVAEGIVSGNQAKTIEILIDENSGRCIVFDVGEPKARTYAAIDDTDGWFAKVRLTNFLPTEANHERSLDAVSGFFDAQHDRTQMLKALDLLEKE